MHCLDCWALLRVPRANENQAWSGVTSTPSSSSSPDCHLLSQQGLAGAEIPGILAGKSFAY